MGAAERLGFEVKIAGHIRDLLNEQRLTLAQDDWNIIREMIAREVTARAEREGE